ncbi:MAG: RNA polymerase sigma factor, partial [Solirubrobacterales bacterium]
MDRATSTELLGSREAPGEAARKRAALELIKCHEQTLRRTARRYSLGADDAEDAYQRALVILLTKAPTVDPMQLIRWMQTVTKHEALAVRRHRERLLGPPGPPGQDGDGPDWIQLVPSERAGPADLAERRERTARSREALATLKPQ